MPFDVSTRSGVLLLLSSLSIFGLACGNGEPDAPGVSGADVLQDTTLSADGVPIVH